MQSPCKAEKTARVFCAGEAVRYDPAPERKGVIAVRESREPEGGKSGYMVRPNQAHNEARKVTAKARTRLDSPERRANL
jgi:hypothetical protein